MPDTQLTAARRGVQMPPVPRRRRFPFYAMLVAPVIVYICAVFVYPLGYSLWISFFQYRLTDPRQTKTFIGLQNYSTALGDPSIRTSIFVTILFVLAAVGVEFLIGMALALLLWKDSAINKVASALLLIPISLTPLVAGLIWRAMLSPDFGSIGYYLARYFGITHGLTAQQGTALISLVLVDAWQWTPLMMLILLAGLRSLPKEPFEATQVDGAGRITTFRYLTLPMMRHTIILALLIRTMDAFKLFDIVFVLTQGGPGDSTEVLNFVIYKQGLSFFHMGYAAAVSNILLVIVGLFAALYILVIGRQRRTNRIAPGGGADA